MPPVFPIGSDETRSVNLISNDIIIDSSSDESGEKSDSKNFPEVFEYDICGDDGFIMWVHLFGHSWSSSLIC